MYRLLLIESTSSVCSVALSEDNTVIAKHEDTSGNNHSELLTYFIYEILRENSISINDIDAIAISEGPGSYTGLRIGVSAAKGLCFASNIPLIAISTLKAMASSISSDTEGSDTLLCPMIDARRMEVYTAIFDKKLNYISGIEAKIIDSTSFSDILLENKIIFFGNGMPKCKESISSPNAIFYDNYVMSAVNLIPLALEKLENKKFEDIAYFEPFYLKEFIAGKSKVKALYEL